MGARQSWYAISAFALILSFANASWSEQQTPAIPYDTTSKHISLIYGATSEAAVSTFYSEVLELERIDNVRMPDGRLLMRYVVGDSELGFVIPNSPLPLHPGGVDAAYGIRMVAFLLPQEKKPKILQNLRTSGREIPEFSSGKAARGYRFEFGMVYDNDGNQIEIVFLDKKTPVEKFRQIQIALSVSNARETQRFMRDVLQLTPRVDEGSLHRYELGLSQIKYIEKAPNLPAWVGTPDDKIGMMMIQFAVEDIHAVVEQMQEHNVKIMRGPFAMGPQTTLLFVEGPDGVVYEFIERPQR